MSFYKDCQYIIDIKSSDEDLAFCKLRKLLKNYMKNYTLDNEFYLYEIDKNNNYKKFRDETKTLFQLLFDMFYDEEQIKEVSLDEDPSVKKEFIKFTKFIESVKFIIENVQTISFDENNDNDNWIVECFNKYMNFCKKYLEDLYNEMDDLNNVMDKLDKNISKLANQIVSLSTSY